MSTLSNPSIRRLIGGLLFVGSAFMSASSAFADGPVTLFKVITSKDDIVIGLTADELAGMGGKDAGSVARALASKGTLTVWQYAVRKGADGELQQGPLRQVGILANASLRIEPFATSL